MENKDDSKGAILSLNDIISPDSQAEPNQVSYQKITTSQTNQPGASSTQIQENQSINNNLKDLDLITTTTTIIQKEPETTTKTVTNIVNSQQPVKESTYYAKKVTTTTTTSTRTNNAPSNQVNMIKYSNTGSGGRSQNNNYSRPGTQTTKTTTTTTTIQRGQYGQNNRNSNTNTTSQVYRGNPRNVQPSTKIGTSQSFSGNRYQPKRPANPSYKPKALSPGPGSIKRKTINRGNPVENVQITHIIFSSKPIDFHINEYLNYDNLKSAPIRISQSDREKFKRKGKMSSTCSCDKIDISKPRKINLKGKTIIYQHARGIGMTNDKKENINPMFYSSDIKKLDPISKKKEKEKVEIITNFRSKGKTFNLPNTTRTTTKTTTYNRGSQNQNYRNGATSSMNNRGGVNRGATGSSMYNRGANGSSMNNRGATGSTIRTTNNYNRGSNMGSGGDGEIIKETKTTVKMGNRSYKNQSQPKTYTTSERTVYNQKNFFNKQ